MRHVFAIAFLCTLSWLSVVGQPNKAATRSDETGLTAPILLSPTVTVSTPKHCDELSGVVKFAATIDTLGLPHTSKTLEASDPRLVGFATELVNAQRFKPGILNGSATAVAVELTVGLQTCALREKHPTSDNFYEFTLRAHPLIVLAVVTTPAAQEAVSATLTETVATEQVGGRIRAPVVTVLTDPKVPISGKLLKHGQCFLSIIVDANGIPQNIHVVRGLQPELDSNVVKAVQNWRFRAALRDGTTPVAIEGTVVATFEYVEKEAVAFANFIPETAEKVFAANARGRKLNCALEPVNADEVIARYMPQSRIPGRILVALVIGTDGTPQNVRIVKGLESSLDMDTVAMVEHLRFNPVMKDSTTPVPVGIVMPVRYRTMVAKPTWSDIFAQSWGFVILALM